MANRYWVGGTNTWNATAGTKWAATSGGAGGASVPTSADDVFFDSASGAAIVTISLAEAKSITCTGFTGTLTGTGSATVYGNVTLVSGMTYLHSGTMTFKGTGTLTTAGKTFSAVTIDGSGITVTLGDALNISTRTITLTQGTLNSAGYSITALNITTSGTSAKTLTLGASTVTLSGGATGAVNLLSSNGVTLNANTSQINLTSATASFSSDLTFYNVSFTSTASNIRTMPTGGTFNNLTLTASGTGFSELRLGTNITVNGTLTCAGSSFSARGFISSNPISTVRTITVATLSANDCDFRDITIAGGAAGASPTRAGNCGNNSGITFPAAKTVYRVGTDTTWGGSSSWATSSGGTGSDSNFPLAQDTVVIDDNTALTGTLTLPRYNIGPFSCATRTSAITLNFSVGNNFHGSFALGSGVTVSGTPLQTFVSTGATTFTSAGKTITFSISISAQSGGTFTLSDAYTSSGIIQNLGGSFNANNYNVTFTRFVSSGTLSRTNTLGSGLWTLTGTGVVWDFSDVTNMTFNKGTAEILLSDTSTTARTFSGGGLSFNKLTIGGATGTSITTIMDANSFTELASTKTVAHTIRFSTNQGTIGTWSVTGTSGNVVTVDSSVAGTQRTFTLSDISRNVNYMSVKDIGVADANRFYVGANSTDGGNNTNVIFTDAPPLPPSGSGGGFLFLLS